MRHESQTIIIEKLHKLIATIEALPEQAEICMADTWTHGESKIFIGYEAFAAMFSGATVERSEYVLTTMVDGCKYMASLRGREKLDGPYVMPSVEVEG